MRPCNASPTLLSAEHLSFHGGIVLFSFRRQQEVLIADLLILLASAVPRLNSPTNLLAVSRQSAFASCSLLSASLSLHR
jgi:hypothetical protein